MDDRRFIEVMRLAAVQAGRVAHHLQGKVSVEEKAGQSTPEGAALTAVDLATQDVLLHAIAAVDRRVAMDAEEDTEGLALFSAAPAGAPVIVLDPIDGTYNYAHGSNDYAVMGGLIRDGRYRAALLHFPAARETYWAIEGQGAWLERGDGAPERVRAKAPADRLLYTPRVPDAWLEALRPLTAAQELSRCSAVCAPAIATGRARAAISERRADRRHAIGFLLTTEAGGVVQFGAHRWRGEDPETLPDDIPATFCTESAELADRIWAALR